MIAVERDDGRSRRSTRSPQHYPGRLTVVPGDAMGSIAAAARRRAGARRREPALQHRDRSAGRLAHHGAWPPWYDRMMLMFQREVAERIVARLAAKPMAGSRCWRPGARGEDPVRHRAVGFRAAAEGDVFGGASSIRAPMPLPCDPRASSASPRPPSASAAKCCAQSLKSLGDRSAAAARGSRH